MFSFTICYYRRSVLKSTVLIYNLFSLRDLICILKMSEIQTSEVYGKYFAVTANRV